MCTAFKRLKTLRVEDVMCRKVVELFPEQNLEDVARRFAARGISSAPVVDRHGHCVGMLSAADFIKPMRGGDGDEPQSTVSDCMTHSVVAVAPYQSLIRAAEIMSRGHVHHLPVVDQEGRVVGVVSTMDIVAALLNAIDEMEVTHCGSSPSEHL